MPVYPIVSASCDVSKGGAIPGKMLSLAAALGVSVYVIEDPLLRISSNVLTGERRVFDVMLVNLAHPDWEAEAFRWLSRIFFRELSTQHGIRFPDPYATRMEGRKLSHPPYLSQSLIGLCVHPN